VPADCTDLLLEGDCFRIDGLRVGFADCVQARLIIELEEVVYELPPGYTNLATATSPQRLSFVPMRCGTVSLGNLSLPDVSLFQLGVLVDAGERAQEVEVDVFALEVATDSPVLRAVFGSLGFDPLNASVRVDDSPATRAVGVDGDIEYGATVAFVPRVDATPLPGTLGQHSAVGWYHDDRDCVQYFGSGYGEVTATRGELERAVPALGPLLGRASQAVACDGTWEFHRF
jgi:hypothetical protein